MENILLKLVKKERMNKGLIFLKEKLYLSESFNNLMKQKEFFSSEKGLMLFIIAEIMLVAFIGYKIFQLLGVKYVNYTVIFFQKPIGINIVIELVIALIIFAIMYFGISLRDKKVMKIHDNLAKTIFGTAKQKFFGMDREVISIFFLEFVFAIIIALAIYIYLDPEVNFVPWPFNYIAFFAFLAFGIYIFSQTKAFREMVYGDSIVKKKIIPAHRLFPTRRLTNKSTGSIRVQHKKHSFTKRKSKKKARKK
jgi:hypothetical protein